MRPRTSLIDKGFDQIFGARPLRRAIQNLIEDPLAEGCCTAASSPATRSSSTPCRMASLSIEKKPERQPVKAR